MFDSLPMKFTCGDDLLIGILEKPAHPGNRAVLVVVGGPQYRIGSHRQFTLLSRALAESGVTAMRFDHRGIGDSEGHTTFENLDPDIKAAIDTLCEQDQDITEIVIWGLCDAASAAMMYAHTDIRVKGLVLLNPWVRSEQTLAKTYVNQYYFSLLLTREFWQRLFTGKVKVFEALRSLVRNIRSAASSRDSLSDNRVEISENPDEIPFQLRMMDGLRRFSGQTLLVLCGDDITAREFQTFVDSERKWRKLLRRESVQERILPGASHTFSSKAWRDQATEWTIDWIRSW